MCSISSFTLLYENFTCVLLNDISHVNNFDLGLFCTSPMYILWWRQSTSNLLSILDNQRGLSHRLSKVGDYQHITSKCCIDFEEKIDKKYDTKHIIVRYIFSFSIVWKHWCPWTGLSPIWASCLSNIIGFHRAFAAGVACQQGMLTPPDTLSCPIWTCMCSYVETSLSKMSCLWTLNFRISLGTSIFSDYNHFHMKIKKHLMFGLLVEKTITF